jgi:sulfur relay (sulfurtransferase) complex TusBCD TusD component (DsrE family)
MSNYLFIQSQDPFTEIRTSHQYQLAQDLQLAGNTVAVLLVQNGVMPARAGACSKEFDALLNSTVVIIADKFALQQREISSNELKQNIYIGTLEHAIDALLAGHKVIWN